ncbi:MAG: Na+/H+ antiporter NhaA [Halieaceae bacterium]|nr:Na+/H+ antiporter NhaA [Halieaceae bacterium]
MKVFPDRKDRDVAPLEKHVEKLVAPISAFTRSQASSGLLLACAVVAALALANSGLADFYAYLRHAHLSLSFADWTVDMSLQHWINDGLMVVFFFLLGLEIKREVIAGDLRDPRQSALVFCMAAGGMAMPALIYLAVTLSLDPAAARGWGIPMATDTAFALGILSVLGSRVPRVAIVMLSALAIVDDIGAVLVISIFYTDDISSSALFWALCCLLLLGLANISGYRRPLPYLVFGIGLWWFVLQSGVHATTAGILAALAVPARPFARTPWFLQRMPQILKRFRRVDSDDKDILETREQVELASEAKRVAEATLPPLQRWEDAIDMPVSLCIVPVFAFVNAGVALPDSVAALIEAPVTVAVVLGLVLGKSVGIWLFAWLGLKLGLARMPSSLSYTHLLGLGLLAGIGFTMSLFIGALAFEAAPQLQEQAKIGILLGSVVAAILGTSVLVAKGASES